METFERKAYEKLASWKDSSQGSTALLIEGAWRVGKSTIAEEFGRRNYASYMLVDFSKAPDDVLGYFVDLRNDLDAFFMYLSSFYGVELHRRDSLIIFDEVQLYPKAREAIKQLVADGVTTTSRQARSSPSARTSRTSSFHQRRSRSA